MFEILRNIQYWEFNTVLYKNILSVLGATTRTYQKSVYFLFSQKKLYITLYYAVKDTSLLDGLGFEHCPSPKLRSIGQMIRVNLLHIPL